MKIDNILKAQNNIDFLKIQFDSKIKKSSFKIEDDTYYYNITIDPNKDLFIRTKKDKIVFLSYDKHDLSIRFYGENLNVKTIKVIFTYLNKL